MLPEPRHEVGPGEGVEPALAPDHHVSGGGRHHRVEVGTPAVRPKELAVVAALEDAQLRVRVVAAVVVLPADGDVEHLGAGLPCRRAQALALGEHVEAVHHALG